MVPNYSRIVASLDRKRLGADCRGGAGSRSEAFSIRRLGGSRWRLRRTRCAMGFERQPGSEQSLGRTARRGRNAVRTVGVAAEMSESVCGKLCDGRWRRGGHTSAWACQSTSLGHPWRTRYEESKKAHENNSAAVSLCIRIIVAPQRGQCQRDEASEEVAQATVSAGVGELLDSSCRDSAKREARQRLA